jgi:hypothetical protein
LRLLTYYSLKVLSQSGKVNVRSWWHSTGKFNNSYSKLSYTMPFVTIRYIHTYDVLLLWWLPPSQVTPQRKGYIPTWDIWAHLVLVITRQIRVYVTRILVTYILFKDCIRIQVHLNECDIPCILVGLNITSRTFPVIAYRHVCTKTIKQQVTLTVYILCVLYLNFMCTW